MFYVSSVYGGVGRRFKWFSSENFENKNWGHRCGKTKEDIDSVFLRLRVRHRCETLIRGWDFYLSSGGWGGTVPDMSLILHNFNKGLMLKFPCESSLTVRDRRKEIGPIPKILWLCLKTNVWVRLKTRHGVSGVRVTVRASVRVGV